MSSAICQNFVQNAWKKELCSNCFKSKDEHAEKPRPRPITLVTNKKVEGIIKTGKKGGPKLSVCFPKDLTEVIGYGGEDWGSDEEQEEEEQDADDDSEDELVSSEPDEDGAKELKRITKENTDFNTVSLAEAEVKKSYNQLLLGKPLVDAAGKKRTLLVSVTPFGEDANNTPAKKFNSKPLSHIPIARNKDVIAENKTNVVLTSYTRNEEDKLLSEKEEKSLLDEISETLENGKNPIQIMSKKKTCREIILDSNKENIEELKNMEVKKIAEIKKADEITNKNLKEDSKTLVSEKKVNLSRTPALKRDIEKPVVYQTSTAKIELLNTKNLKLTKENTNKAKSEVNNNSLEKIEVDSGKNGLKEIENNIKMSTANFIKAEITSKVETKEQKEEINATMVDRMEKNSNSAEDKKQEKVVNFTVAPVPVKFQSREQAGKPDGREDPFVNELPPLPVTPPPQLEIQNSFLHNSPPVYEKPKIPSKPSTVLIRKPPILNSHSVQTQPLSTFTQNIDKPMEKAPLTKQDSDLELKANKRKAPKPPEELQLNNQIYARNFTSSMNFECPVVREKEKRERASSCVPKMLEESFETPEPAPRKSLSISTDCLTEEKRKEKSKGRFSLKKFLRMGSSKDLTKTSDISNGKLDETDQIPPQPKPKPRLVIVHPSELNGAKVEVVAKQNADQRDFAISSDYEPFTIGKASKPPPPPRNYDNKPSFPHPPKSVEILNKQRQIFRSNSSSKNTETVYANIGEVRSALVPNKPVRTASMREREALQQKQLRRNPNYEPINIGNKDGTENVYDYINASTRSSSPESDKSSPKTKVVRLGKRSESSIDVSGEYFKYGNIPRSMSLTYCGSETESEIYSPYSFYGSESEVTEDDHDWIQNGKTHKLRSRKGRSIVHKNLEDNYGAVIVANHEALAQVLENIQQTSHIQPALRGLKTSSNLRWTDFSIKTAVSPVVVGRRVFYQALWGAQHVTLIVNVGTQTSSPVSLGCLNLCPVTEFSDLVPKTYLDFKEKEKDDNKTVQATISVLPWLQINTIESYGDLIKTKAQNHEEAWKDANFVMLQLVNALKTLQAQGIEELPLSLESFVLCKDIEKDVHHRLCILQGLSLEVSSKSSEEKYGTLCTCALKALNFLQPSPKVSPIIQSLLTNERAVSLTQVKSILEFSLWGPSDVSLGSTIRERELALQRWLDLQRATVLHGLVCARVQLTVYEECHLLFLVRSNARMMCDASLLIESSHAKHMMTNGHK